VIYLAAEGGDELGQRANAWHRARRRKADAPFHVVPVSIDLKAEAWRVVETVQAQGITPAFVVIDTMSQTFSGEENVANDVAAYMRELGNRFRDLWQCAVLVVHHSGHTATERPRGSSAIQANSDYLYGVFRDEKEMLATLSCMHRKGGGAFDDAIFQLTREVLGQDSDGDEVSSLVARHLTSAEEVQEAMEAEGKAGRGGHNQLFLRLANNGMTEAELRKAFGDECGADTTDGQRKAYWRARKWACTKGFIEIVQGRVLTLKRG
jgi:KaiC/GvpD/RAD55 family RecA-like ATPase